LDGTLKLISNALAYADLGETSNPTQKYFDWAGRRTYAVENPQGVPHTIDPGATLSLFSGTRSLAVDNTTSFRLDLSLLASNRYRFTWTSGTDPVLRTARSLSLNSRAVTVTANANLTATFASQAGDWTAVQVGDVVFIPDPTTGDAQGPFNVLNTGYWSVLSVAGDGSSVQLARPSGTGFLAYAETATVTSNSQVLAFSAGGVQVGDSVNINAGFTAPVLGTYEIVAVTSKWFEVLATAPLPSGVSASPGAAGIQIYTQAKRWVRFEADQACVIRAVASSASLAFDERTPRPTSRRLKKEKPPDTGPSAPSTRATSSASTRTSTTALLPDPDRCSSASRSRTTSSPLSSRRARTTWRRSGAPAPTGSRRASPSSRQETLAIDEDQGPRDRREEERAAGAHRPRRHAR
jgi:hypothetical protein